MVMSACASGLLHVSVSGKDPVVAMLPNAADEGFPQVELADEYLGPASSEGSESVGRLLNGFRDYLGLVARSELSQDLASKLSASDLVQETFLGAHRDFAHFRGQTKGDLRGWLRGILINNLGRVRRHYRDTEKRSIGREQTLDVASVTGWMDIPDDSATPASHAVRREELTSVVAALQSLPEPQRSVVVWHQCDGETFEAIGRRLGRSEEATRKLWVRALLRMTRELGPNHDPRS